MPRLATAIVAAALVAFCGWGIVAGAAVPPPEQGGPDIQSVHPSAQFEEQLREDARQEGERVKAQRAERNKPERRAERQKSRTAFGGQTDAQAVETIRSYWGGVVSRTPEKFPKLSG